MWRRRLSAAVISWPLSSCITARFGVDRFDRGEFAVGDAKRAVGRAELDSIASCEDSLFFAEDFDAEEPDRIIFDAAPVGRLDRQQVGIAINSFDAGIAAVRESRTVCFHE